MTPERIVKLRKWAEEGCANSIVILEILTALEEAQRDITGKEKYLANTEEGELKWMQRAEAAERQIARLAACGSEKRLVAELVAAEQRVKDLEGAEQDRYQADSCAATMEGERDTLQQRIDKGVEKLTYRDSTEIINIREAIAILKGEADG